MSWKTLNKTKCGILVREIVDGSRVWIVQAEGSGMLLPIHESSMQKEEER